MRSLIMKYNPFLVASCVTSILLIPVAMYFGPNVFYVFCLINFIFFHGIWISRYMGEPDFVFDNKFFIKQMRLPIILFMACGLFGLALSF